MCGAELRRVLAARDREAIQPLYWGVTSDERFMVRWLDTRKSGKPHLGILAFWTRVGSLAMLKT